MNQDLRHKIQRSHLPSCSTFRRLMKISFLSLGLLTIIPILDVFAEEGGKQSNFIAKDPQYLGIHYGMDETILLNLFPQSSVSKKCRDNECSFGLVSNEMMGLINAVNYHLVDNNKIIYIHLNSRFPTTGKEEQEAGCIPMVRKLMKTNGTPTMETKYSGASAITLYSWSRLTSSMVLTCGHIGIQREDWIVAGFYFDSPQAKIPTKELNLNIESAFGTSVSTSSPFGLLLQPDWKTREEGARILGKQDNPSVIPQIHTYLLGPAQLPAFYSHMLMDLLVRWKDPQLFEFSNQLLHSGKPGSITRAFEGFKDTHDHRAVQPLLDYIQQSPTDFVDNDAYCLLADFVTREDTPAIALLEKQLEKNPPLSCVWAGLGRIQDHVAIDKSTTILLSSNTSESYLNTAITTLGHTKDPRFGSLFIKQLQKPVSPPTANLLVDQLALISTPEIANKLLAEFSSGNPNLSGGFASVVTYPGLTFQTLFEIIARSGDAETVRNLEKLVMRWSHQQPVPKGTMNTGKFALRVLRERVQEEKLVSIYGADLPSVSTETVTSTDPTQILVQAGSGTPFRALAMNVKPRLCPPNYTPWQDSAVCDNCTGTIGPYLAHYAFDRFPPHRLCTLEAISLQWAPNQHFHASNTIDTSILDRTYGISRPYENRSNPCFPIHGQLWKPSQDYFIFVNDSKTSIEYLSPRLLQKREQMKPVSPDDCSDAD